jgi:transposase
MSSLESMVDQDNPVRLIDAFVDQLDLVKLKFLVRELKKEGRPAFESVVFLKLYFYGYLNGLRSSRRLERECCRNTELQWLLGGLRPNYHTIADFRKHNPTALRNTFKLFVLFLKDSQLVNGRTVAVDGTKVRASNSKKNNYNEKKIERHMSYIESKTREYLEELDRMYAMERKEFPDKVKEVKKKILQLKENKIKYEALGDMMADDNEPQISTTDPDSRALLVQGQVVEVSYNVQTAVDSEHNLVVATHVINRNDRNALSDIALEAKSNLSCDEMTVLADKGYHNGREISRCAESGVSTIVATPEIVNSNE